MKTAFWCAVALSVLVAGCSSGEGTDQSSSAVGSRKGVDYSWARPSPSGLYADGYTFAARYLSYGSGKDISAGEAQGLKAAGVDVVVVWETSATAALGGYGQGVSDAQAAASEAQAAGMPAGRPIYFAVDFDAQPSEQGSLDAYFDGVAAVIGRGRTGAYGGYYVIDRLFNAGKIAYGWQTYAWSYGNWDARAQVRQVQNGITAAGDGNCCDEDIAVANDFGQWGYASKAPSVVETAFQANTGSLWTVGSGGNTDWKLGMMKGTSPAIAALGSGGFEVAFQANTSDLWTVGNAGNTDWKLGMMTATSPSIAALGSGGFEVAFQANTGNLWTVGNAGNMDWKLGMMAGTSPSITALEGGGFEVAFQANTGDLWTVGDAGNTDWKLGMMAGTSPSIVALPGGFEVAFQANTGDLWTVGNAGNTDWKLGMMKGTSPSITALAGSGFEVAFQANTTDLWTVGNAGNKDWNLGMMAFTSPSIAALAGGGFQVSFEANTSDLWTVGNAGDADWKLGMMVGTSPSGT